MSESRSYQEEKLTEASEHRGTTTTPYTTTTKTHGAGRVLLQPIDMEAIRSGYVELLGPLNSFKARDIECAIQNGLQASAILDALEQTALAPRPSHAYFRTILQRYIRQHIHTEEEAEEDRRKFRVKIETYKEQQFTEWYNPPIDDLFYTLIHK